MWFRVGVVVGRWANGYETTAEGFVLAFAFAFYLYLYLYFVFLFLDGERTVMKAAAGRGATGQAMCQAFLPVFVFKIVITMVIVFVYRIVTR